MSSVIASIKAFRGDQQRWAVRIVVAILTVSIIYPIWTVVKQSVFVSREDQTFTLQWYRDLVSPSGMEAIVTTGILVLTSGVLAVVLGLALAWMIERVDVPFTVLARMVPLFPLLVPGVMGAAAWAFLLSPRVGFLNAGYRALVNSKAPDGPLDIFSLWGVIFVVTLYIVPFTYTVFYPAFRSMDGSMEEAAYIAGANRWTAARTVTLGLVRPALLGAVLMAFVLSLAHFTIPQMLGRGEVQVLTTRIYNFMTREFPANVGGATATSMVALVPSLAFLLLQYRLLRRGSYAVIGGKGGGANKIRTRPVRWFAGLSLIGYSLLAFVLPMAAIVVVAFSPFWSGRIEPSEFTMRNFEYVFTQFPDTFTAIKNSAILGFVGATLSILLAFVIAYLSQRSRVRGAKILDLVGTIPAGIPTTVFGLGFLLAFISGPLVLYGTLWLVLLAYLVIFIPYAIRPISAAIRQVSPELEDASRMAGTSWFGTVRRITLPLVLTALLGGWALLFVMLSREVAASVFLLGAGVRLVGTTIFGLWVNAGNVGGLSAFSLVIIIASFVFIAFAQWVQSRQTLRLGWGTTQERDAAMGTDLTGAIEVHERPEATTAPDPASSTPRG